MLVVMTLFFFVEHATNFRFLTVCVAEVPGCRGHAKPRAWRYVEQVHPS
jgi:hypothetical protein